MTTRADSSQGEIGNRVDVRPGYGLEKGGECISEGVAGTHAFQFFKNLDKRAEFHAEIMSNYRAIEGVSARPRWRGTR
jgi:hypothetical protein